MLYTFLKRKNAALPDRTTVKDIKYSELYQAYGGLLTPSQAEITEMYYLFDLSLSEIAEIKSVTRQSVADTLKKVRAELDGLEEKLGILRRKRAVTEFSKTLSEDKKEALMKLLED